MKFTQLALLSIASLRGAFAADSSSASGSSSGRTTILSSSQSTSTSVAPSSSSSVVSSTSASSSMTSSHSSSSSSSPSSSLSSSASSITSSSSKDESSSAASSSSDDVLSSMPSIAATSTISEYSSSSYNVTFTAGVPTVENPFTKNSTLPTGTLFIIFGAFLGFVVVGLIVSRWVLWCVSYRAAKKSNHGNFTSLDYNYDPSIFNDMPLKKNYTQSIYSLGSQSTLNVLGSNISMENLATQGQGRSYRDAMTRASRNSMFISPTEMLQMGTYENPASAGYLSNVDSPIESPTTSNFSPTEYRRRTSRPPSVYMDKMLDDDLDDFDISSGNSSYDQYADEKV